MKAIVSLILVSVFLALLPHSVSAQCGDINDDGNIDLADITYLLDYLVTGGPPPPDSTQADLDDRYGITYADLMLLTNNAFGDPNALLDCSIDNTYSFSCSMENIVGIPLKYAIPVTTNDVYLDIVANWSDAHFGYLIYFDPLGLQSNGTFDYVGPVARTSEVQVAERAGLIEVSYFGPVSAGQSALVTLHYTRVAPGIGKIAAGLPDVGHQPLMVTNQYDLHRPVLVHKYPGGDMNCDTNADIADLTAYVDFLFNGGARPCDPYHGP